MKLPYEPMIFTVILTTPEDTITNSVIVENDNRAENPRDWE